VRKGSMNIVRIAYLLGTIHADNEPTSLDLLADRAGYLESGTGTPGEPEADGPGTRAGGHIARSAVYASRTNRDASGGEARASVRSTLLLVVPLV